MAEVDLSISAPGTPEVETTIGTASNVVMAEAPQVEESLVRGLLSSMGMGLHYAAGDKDVKEHWRFSPRELDELVPPLTRIINRRNELRRAVIRGDEITVATLLAGYTGRNIVSGAQARKKRKDEENADESGKTPKVQNGNDSGNSGTIGIIPTDGAQNSPSGTTWTS